MQSNIKFLIILGLVLVLNHYDMRSSQGYGNFWQWLSFFIYKLRQVTFKDSDEDTDFRKGGKGRTVTFNREREQNKYRGCYKDTGARMLKHHFNFGQPCTIQHCINFCRELGYVYAGVQHFTHCFCGNTLPKNSPKFPKLGEGKCNTPCRGNPSQMCGGTWANSVYETGNESKCATWIGKQTWIVTKF